MPSAGDTMLLQGTWKALDHRLQDPDVLVVNSPELVRRQAVPMGPGSQDIPSGRWSLHPDGYYIRYVPQGYSHTVVGIWVPQGSPAVGKEYDPATHIAVPGNTSRQRLIQSGRAYQSH